MYYLKTRWNCHAFRNYACVKSVLNLHHKCYITCDSTMNRIYDEASSLCEFSASHHKVRGTWNITRFHPAVSLLTKLRHHLIPLTLQPSHVNAPKWNPAAGSSHTLHCWFICNYRNYRSYSKEIRQSQLLRLILGRIKCGVIGWWGSEPVFYVCFDFYSSHDILRMFEQDLEYEKSNWKYVVTSINEYANNNNKYREIITSRIRRS